MIGNVNEKVKLDQSVKFSHYYQDNLFIQYDTPKAKKSLYQKFPGHMVNLLSPANINSKTLYFCHIPEHIRAKSGFEKLVLSFLPNKTLKIRPYIAERVYTVTFEKIEDAILIATFLPQIDFTQDDDYIPDDDDFFQEEEEEEEDEGVFNRRPRHITVADSWFKIPVVRISNIPERIKREKFRNLPIIRDASFLHYQKIKGADKNKTNLSVIIICKSLKQAKAIIKEYNYGSLNNEMVYVNWFVDTDYLEKLERYKIKVFPPKYKDFDEANESDFYEIMSNYGKVFSVTLYRAPISAYDFSNQEIGKPSNNNGDENSKENNLSSGIIDDEDKDDHVLFVNVVFIDKNDIKKVQNDFQISYWFAAGMLYNFPFETTVQDVSEYLSPYLSKITKIELRNQDQVEKDPKNIPFFYLTFDSIDSVDEVFNYVEANLYQAKQKKIKMQPFLIPKEKNLPSTIQRYNLHRDSLLKSNTILVENLNADCTSTGLIDLFSEYGTIMFIKIDDKEFTANITFGDASEMEAAIDNVNGYIFNKAKLSVTQYVFSSGSKKKKKSQKNADNDDEDEDENEKPKETCSTIIRIPKNIQNNSQNNNKPVNNNLDDRNNNTFQGGRGNRNYSMRANNRGGRGGRGKFRGNNQNRNRSGYQQNNGDDSA